MRAITIFNLLKTSKMKKSLLPLFALIYLLVGCSNKADLKDCFEAAIANIDKSIAEIEEMQSYLAANYYTEAQMPADEMTNVFMPMASEAADYSDQVKRVLEQAQYCTNNDNLIQTIDSHIGTCNVVSRNVRDIYRTGSCGAISSSLSARQSELSIMKDEIDGIVSNL